MKETELVFKPKRLAAILAVAHFGTWLIWTFISLNPAEPFIVAFSTENSRGFYVLFLMAILFMGLPYYTPFEEKK